MSQYFSADTIYLQQQLEVNLERYNSIKNRLNQSRERSFENNDQKRKVSISKLHSLLLNKQNQQLGFIKNNMDISNIPHYLDIRQNNFELETNFNLVYQNKSNNASQTQKLKGFFDHSCKQQEFICITDRRENKENVNQDNLQTEKVLKQRELNDINNKGLQITSLPISIYKTTKGQIMPPSFSIYYKSPKVEKVNQHAKPVKNFKPSVEKQKTNQISNQSYKSIFQNKKTKRTRTISMN